MAHRLSKLRCPVNHRDSVQTQSTAPKPCAWARAAFLPAGWESSRTSHNGLDLMSA